MKNIVQLLLQQRLPSFIGFIILGASLITIAWLSRNALLFGTKAATAAVPNTVQIANISATSFSISYLTEEKVTGTISYGEEQNQKNIALDDRDKQGDTALLYRIHHITVKDLKPKTRYFVVINSDEKTFDNNGKPYEITTAPQIPEQATMQSLRGTVSYENGSIPLESLIFASTKTSQLVSSLTKPDGSYEIPIATLLTKDLNAAELITNTSEFQIIITDALAQSTVSFLFNNTYQIPPVNLSQNYDFIATNPTIASPSATIPAFPTAEESFTNEPQIITPQEKETFTDQQPLFRGKAPPNETVTIIINSTNEITVTVQTDNTGTWEYRPEAPLTPGEHTITIDAVSLSGIAKKITQSFTVYAEGGKFIEPSISPSSSPSAIPTATTKPKITVTTKPTAIPTTSPTKLPTATTPPSLTPTKAIASASGAITKSPIPPTGNSSALTIVIGIFTSIGICALLFFLAAV